jgi:hypothetical protein
LQVKEEFGFTNNIISDAGIPHIKAVLRLFEGLYEQAGNSTGSELFEGLVISSIDCESKSDALEMLMLNTAKCSIVDDLSRVWPRHIARLIVCHLFCNFFSAFHLVIL